MHKHRIEITNQPTDPHNRQRHATTNTAADLQSKDGLWMLENRVQSIHKSHILGLLIKPLRKETILAMSSLLLVEYLSTFTPFVLFREPQEDLTAKLLLLSRR